MDAPTQTTQTLHQLRASTHEVAWSLWSELGVSSWTPTRHKRWGIELEPLIVLTGSLPEIDVRLRNEVIDWCVTNDRYVSLTQLRRNIVRMHGGQPPAELLTFTATVSQLGRRRWPLAADREPLQITLSGKSSPPQLNSAALYQLRLRAIFGVGARAEILRVLSLDPHELTISQIADRISYTVRQVALDAEMLAGSGIVRRAQGPGPARYTLSDPSSLAALVGERPEVSPRWIEPFTTLFHLIGALQTVVSDELHAPDVELWRLLRQVEERSVDLRIPQDLRRRPSLEGLAGWAVSVADHLATGDVTAYEP